MLIKEYFRMAIDSIRTNKMRALLTMLGIIIGIASVITIIAAGDGVRAYMNSQLEAVGTNTVIVSVDTEEGTDSDLITNDDLEALQDNELVRAVTPQIVGFGSANFRKSTMGASISYRITVGFSASFVTIRYMDVPSFLKSHGLLRSMGTHGTPHPCALVLSYHIRP